MMLVDPSDRFIVANEVDTDGVVRPSRPVFVARLPDSEPIPNATMEFKAEEDVILDDISRTAMYPLLNLR